MGGYRMIEEKHWNESNLWTSDTSKMKRFLLRYIYDWYYPMNYDPDIRMLVSDYPQPLITEKTEQKLYIEHMNTLLPVRPVGKSK